MAYADIICTLHISANEHGYWRGSFAFHNPISLSRYIPWGYLGCFQSGHSTVFRFYHHSDVST